MSKVYGGVYEIINIINNKRYVGSTVNLRTRLNDHKRMLTKNSHTNPKLQAGFNKYGIDCFRFNKLAILEKSELLPTEQRLLDIEFKKEDTYNICPFADAPMRGRTKTKECIEKHRLAVTGRKHTEEAKLKMSIAQKNMPKEYFIRRGMKKRGVPSLLKGTHKSICRNGHEKTEENSYIFQGKWYCLVCKENSKKNRENSLVLYDFNTVSFCRHGHQRTKENTYIINGAKYCRICKNNAYQKKRVFKNLYKGIGVEGQHNKGKHVEFCKNGHEKTIDNVYINKGTWNCRICRANGTKRSRENKKRIKNIKKEV